MIPPRIGLIGARRVRQGLGPFVARHLVRCGAEVPAFLGTKRESVRQAAAELERVAGVRAAGTTDFAELLDHGLDALAILTPAETHEAFLQRALEAGLPVLCEKPLIWGGRNLAQRSRSLVEAFGERSLSLTVNCQWPHILPAFSELHPDALGSGPPRSFSMRLSPESTGVQALGDSLPHPLSLLQALHGSLGCRVADASFHGPRLTPQAEGLAKCPPESPVLLARFRFVSEAGETDVEVTLARSDSLPRPAAVTINGARAGRLVRTTDYAQFLASGSRLVSLPDPMGVLIEGFVTHLREDTSPRPAQRVLERMAMLETLVTSFASSNT